MRYESVIHEFDPYFNFRTTKFLATEGFLDFLNWFDDRGWYPLGRTIGGTIYPGLMATAASFYWVLHALHVTINIRNMCVFVVGGGGWCVGGGRCWFVVGVVVLASPRRQKSSPCFAEQAPVTLQWKEHHRRLL